MTETKIRKTFFTLLMAFTACALALLFLSEERGTLVISHYVCPLVFAFAGMTLLEGSTRQKTAYWIGSAFVAWFAVSRILLKELYLDDSFTTFACQSCTYLFAFPFAYNAKSKNGLRIASVIWIIVYSLVAWIGVFSAVYSQNITLPLFKTEILMDPKELRLYAGGHPNFAACMFMLAFMLAVWFAAQLRTRCKLFPFLLACIGCYAGIALADSRTVMIQIACFSAGLAFTRVTHTPLKNNWKKYLLASLAGIICLVVVFAGFDWVKLSVTALANNVTAHAEEVEKQVVAKRVLLDTTLTGRTYIYRKLIQLIQQQPRIFLAGMRNSELTRTILKATRTFHAHNSYLQTLLHMGLPALLMAFYFTVMAVWKSLKLIFNSRAAWTDQILAIMLLAFLLGTLTEPYLFSDFSLNANFPFFLILGYVLEAERKLKLLTHKEERPPCSWRP